MKVIHLGVGGFGHHWSGVLTANDDIEVVALVDVSEKTLAAACEKYGYDPAICYQTLDEALLKVPADTLICVTPPDYHLEHTSKALQAGLDVICEKPMANTIEDCTAMLEASRQYGRQLIISQNYRFRPDMFTIARLIKEGAIGEIGQIKLDFYKGWYFDETNFRQTMPYPTIIDMSIHHFDLLRFLTGLEGETVRGEAWNPHWSENVGDTSTSLHFLMNNDARFVYNASWCAQGDFCNWNGNWLIEGDKGSLVYDKGRIVLNKALGRYTVGKPKVIKPDKMALQSQDYLLAEHIQAKTDGHTLPTHVADNIRSIAMVFAAVTAVQTETAVPVLTPALKSLLLS